MKLFLRLLFVIVILEGVWAMKASAALKTLPSLQRRRRSSNLLVRMLTHKIHDYSVPPLLHTSILDHHITAKKSWKSGGPCSRTDFWCMNAVGLKYVNELRKRVKPSTDTDMDINVAVKKQSLLSPLFPLKMGTLAMVESALRQSKRMKRQHETFHQHLSHNHLGCYAIYHGENIASTHLILGEADKPSDPGKLCVEKFAKSKDHYRNMISSRNQHFAMGVYIDAKDYVYCTQIFTIHVKHGKGKCKKAPMHYNQKALHAKKGNQKKKQHMTASTGYLFKKSVYADSFDDGFSEEFALKCGYCSRQSGECLSEDQSILIDNDIKDEEELLLE